jgi:hypothetical protein
MCAPLGPRFHVRIHPGRSTYSKCSWSLSGMLGKALSMDALLFFLLGPRIVQLGPTSSPKSNQPQARLLCRVRTHRRTRGFELVYPRGIDDAESECASHLDSRGIEGSHEGYLSCAEGRGLSITRAIPIRKQQEEHNKRLSSMIGGRHSPRRRPPATGLPGDYPDRTPTGWRTQASGPRTITRSAPPPLFLRVARARWARC